MLHNLGRVVATAAVAASVPNPLLTSLLDRHAASDWGDLDGKRSQVETPRHLNPSQLRLTNQVAFSHPFCCVS
jgi:hypothetical protein